MVDYSIQGAEHLELVARRLKDLTDGGDIKRQLLRGIRETNKPTIAAIKASALVEMPRRGGFAALVARESIGTRTRLTGNSAGVTIQRKRGAGLNAGRLRHPVWGNRKVWKQQAVAKDWFTRPIVADAPQIRAELQKVLADTASKIAKGL